MKPRQRPSRLRTLVIFELLWWATFFAVITSPDFQKWSPGDAVHQVDITPYVLASIIALVVPGMWLFASRSRAGSEDHTFHEVRARRLALLADAPNSAERYPHRLVEQALPAPAHARRNPRRVIDALQPVLPQLPPGAIVIVDGPSTRSTFLPVAMDRSFEPIQLQRGNIEDLIRWNLTAQGICSELDSGETVNPLRRAAPPPFEPYIAVSLPLTQGGDRVTRTLSRLATAAGYALGLLVFSSVITALLAADLWPPAVALCALFGGFLYLRMRPAIHDRRAWLIPGGLVISEHPNWRTQADFIHCSREAAPLVMDWMNCTAYTVSDGRVTQLPGGWAVLAAWLNTARTPTADAMASFLGKTKQSEKQGSE